ncbi:hypothetical protein KY285_020387 [Solanum tuberosum]|nr:hypothetical protein KY285_020387 [Solanum tuberosum]
MHRLQDLRMGFIFQDPSECNLSVVQEFYPNWKPDGHSHFVTVRGVEVSFTPSVINQVLGTTESSFDILTGLNIIPPYQQIRHTFCGVPKEVVDYLAPLFTRPLDVTETKGLENMHRPTLTTLEGNKRDDVITEQLDEIATRYPLNEHADALLGLGPAFLEPVWDDIPTDEDKRRTMSNSESDSDA